MIYVCGKKIIIELKLQEKEIIRKEANKALKKYSRKYTGTDLRNHIYLSLANKGFGYDDIYALINEMEL